MMYGHQIIMSYTLNLYVLSVNYMSIKLEEKIQIKPKETIWEKQNKGSTVNGTLHGSTVSNNYMV